jgi:hypothetical protein
VFTDEFLDSLPVERVAAAYALAEEFVHRSEETELDALARYATYVEAYAAIRAYYDTVGLSYDFPELGDDRSQNLQIINNVLQGRYRALQKEVVSSETQATFASSHNRFKARFGNLFAYRFNDADLSRVQQLLNELRDAIVGSDDLEADHRQRILKRIEQVQCELHKEMSDVDRLWGLIGDAGVVFGKLGRTAKPFVDCVKEIARITWAVQARAEGLPSATGLPFLNTDQESITEQDA